MLEQAEIKFSIKPTKLQIENLQRWLIEEEAETGEGFYCNWEIIENEIKDKRIAIAYLKKEIIGFATWLETSSLTVNLNIVEIKSNYRKKGLCKKLINYLFDYFKKLNILAVDLQCAPASSEIVWRNLGFTDFPKSNGTVFWDRKNKELYKILVETCKNERSLSNNSIELWNEEPHFTENIKPFMIWKIECLKETVKLFYPIVYPCNPNWRIRWTQNGKVIKDDKIKYFTKNEIRFGNFLVITELPK